MKYYCCLLFFITFFSFSARAQLTNSPCHSVNDFLDEVSGKYYWGSPKWLAMMDSALILCPSSAKAWGNKGIIYMMRGDVASWYLLAEKAVQFDPLYFLGNRAYHRMRYLRDYEGALKDLQKLDSIAGLRPVYVADVHSYILIGQCKEGLGDRAGALEYYNRSIENQIKERGESWVGTYDYLIRGILKYEMNDYEGALTDLDKQAKLYEQLADTYYYRGLVHKMTNHSDLARIDFEKAKELLTGQGFKRWDAQVVLVNEVYLSDIDTALTALN